MKAITTLLCLLVTVSLVTAQEKARKAGREKAAQPKSNENLEFEGARKEIYKTIGDVNLSIYIFEPKGHKASDATPAIVFFFGGGWRAGSPTQFENHCRYLASRGMVAMTADYRVSSRHNTKALQCVNDGKSAIRWVRENAKRLGVDPKRVAAGGGSAGGHVAACTGVIQGLEEKGENLKISSRPDAMVLFNPALVLAPVEGRPTDEEKMQDLSERMGIEPKKLSPFHNVSKGVPPTIVFHGKADTTVPYWTAEIFTEAMQKAGNKCELAGSEGQAHGFFNFGRGDNKYFIETVRDMDKFLKSLGWLKGEPTIDRFLSSASK